MITPATLDARGTAAFLGMSTARLRREVAEGTVPGPLRLAGKRKLWSRPLLERWLAGEADRPDVDPILNAIDSAIDGEHTCRSRV